MREVITNFQQSCLLTGMERSRLLQKLLSAAIAYASPCVIGGEHDGMSFYRTLVLPKAIKLISDVNERVLLDTTQALKDIEDLYQTRYDTLNSCRIPLGKVTFTDTLTNQGFDYSTHYNQWCTPFLTAACGAMAKLEV